MTTNTRTVAQYEAVLRQLYRMRAEGDLSQEDELEVACDLHDLWVGLTESEQLDMEELAEHLKHVARGQLELYERAPQVGIPREPRAAA